MKLTALARGLLLLACLSAVIPEAQANNPPKMTREEIALTSPWCRYAQLFGHDKSAYQAMLQKYGDGFRHIHHYCWAEIDGMRLYKPSKNPAYASASRAIGNLDYVLDRTQPSFAFWKDAMILKIRILDQSGDTAQAVVQAQKLIQNLPDFADGYTIFASLLLKGQRRQEAMKVLALGAERASDKERFERLKGSLDLR